MRHLSLQNLLLLSHLVPEHFLQVFQQQLLAQLHFQMRGLQNCLGWKGSQGRWGCCHLWAFATGLQQLCRAAAQGRCRIAWCRLHGGLGTCPMLAAGCPSALPTHLQKCSSGSSSELYIMHARATEDMAGCLHWMQVILYCNVCWTCPNPNWRCVLWAVLQNFVNC